MNVTCATCRNMSFCSKYRALTQALLEIPPFFQVGTSAPTLAGPVAATFDQVAAACPEYRAMDEVKFGTTIVADGVTYAVMTAVYGGMDTNVVWEFEVFAPDRRRMILRLYRDGKVSINEPCEEMEYVEEVRF